MRDDSKPVDNNERQTHSSKRKRAPVPSHQRRHDTDNNDSGNTINDGGDGEDTGEFSQPWTRVKYKARKALTTQNARNNSNNRSNKQKLRLSEHDIHAFPFNFILCILAFFYGHSFLIAVFHFVIVFS